MIIWLSVYWRRKPLVAYRQSSSFLPAHQTSRSKRVRVLPLVMVEAVITMIGLSSIYKGICACITRLFHRYMDHISFCLVHCSNYKPQRGHYSQMSSITLRAMKHISIFTLLW